MSVLSVVSPVVRGVRLFVAASGGAVPSGVVPAFDPALSGRFALGAPLAGWFDLGAVLDLKRDAVTTFAEVASGAPALVKTRARAKVTAAVSCTFAGWSKLALLLSGGSQGMNLLRRGVGGSVALGANLFSGGAAEAAMPVLAGSTATVLQMPAGSSVSAGDAVVVDEDYARATGWLGSGVPGTFLRNALVPGSAVDYVRRVSLNVARVVSVAATGGFAGGPPTLAVTLGAPLLAGVPSATAKLGVVLGFTDRLGGSYVSEWSGLFVLEGVQGDRVLLHYPRLQAAPGVDEVMSPLAAGLERWRLRANLHALPVVDANDGEAVLCFRTYLPAPLRAL